MESPKRKMQKQQDYLRHKFFRKLAKRKKAAKERESKAAEKELTRRLKMTPPRYGDGKAAGIQRQKNGHDVRIVNDGTFEDQVTGENLGSVVLDNVNVSGIDRRPWYVKIPTYQDMGYGDYDYNPYNQGSFWGVPAYDRATNSVVTLAAIAAGEGVINPSSFIYSIPGLVASGYDAYQLTHGGSTIGDLINNKMAGITQANDLLSIYGSSLETIQSGYNHLLRPLARMKGIRLPEFKIPIGKAGNAVLKVANGASGIYGAVSDATDAQAASFAGDNFGYGSNLYQYVGSTHKMRGLKNKYLTRLGNFALDANGLASGVWGAYEDEAFTAPFTQR